MKNLTWQNPEQLFVAQELINKVKSKCCGIKDNIEEICGDAYELEPACRLNNLKRNNLKSIIQKASELIRKEASRHSIYLQPSDMLFLMKHIEIPRTLLFPKSEKLVNMVNKMYAAGLKSSKLQNLETVIPEIS